MITRRAALKLAAALTAAGAAPPFAVSAEAAAALLDGPAEPVAAPPRRSVLEPEVLDPVDFAVGLDGLDSEALYHHAAPEYAAYVQAVDALFRDLPILFAVPGDHPVHQLDEAAHALSCTMWMAGVRAGAAYEHLRLSLLAPTGNCRRCWGHGALWGGKSGRTRGDGTNEAPCPDCAGTGLVPTPVPALAGLA